MSAILLSLLISDLSGVDAFSVGTTSGVVAAAIVLLSSTWLATLTWWVLPLTAILVGYKVDISE